MRGRKTTCTCLKGLSFDDRNDACFYLEEFSCKGKADRQVILMEWMRYAKVLQNQLGYTGTTGAGSNPRVFLLPASSETLICGNACARLIGFGQSAWLTVKKAFDSGESPYHKLNGKPSNNKSQAFDDLLHEFFIKLEGLAAPRATRLVRDIVGDRVEVSLRDNDEEGEIELPTYYTKRSLYKKLAADNQWEFECSNKGQYTNKKSTIESNPVTRLPDWSTFQFFWKKHYSHIRIPKPSEDICEDCHKFVNAYKTSAAIRKRKLEAIDDGSSSGEDDNVAGVSVASATSASVPDLDDDTGAL
jgi:hypothetical protein